jgi:hypothetical protein
MTINKRSVSRLDRAEPGQLTQIGLTSIMVPRSRPEISHPNQIFGIAPWKRWLN